MNEEEKNGERNKIKDWFTAKGASDLYDKFKDFRCVEDIMMIKEEEFAEVNVVRFQDKMTMRRLLAEYHEEPQPASKPMASPNAQVHQQDREEEEMKRMPEPSTSDVQQYFKYGVRFIFHSGKDKSGGIRSDFANNPKEEPYYSVKMYIPAPHSHYSKMYKYPPRVVIRYGLELLQKLRIFK